MLSNRTASQPSRFIISILDAEGVRIPAVSASWGLFDEQGVQIDAGAIVDFNPAEDFVSFDVDATALSLPADAVNAGREIVVYLTGATGDQIEVRDYFLVVSSQPLAVMTNSFVTYPEALAIRTEFSTLLGWDGVDRDQQCRALAQAFRNLCRMSYKVPGYNGTIDNQDKAYWGLGSDEGIFWDRGGRRVRVSTLTPEEFSLLPAAFKRALKRAQLAEASVLLGGDAIGDKRRAGLISETVGESSAFFDSKPYLNLPISKQAYQEVQRYVYLKVGIRRA